MYPCSEDRREPLASTPSKPLKRKTQETRALTMIITGIHVTATSLIRAALISMIVYSDTVHCFVISKNCIHRNQQGIMTTSTMMHPQYTSLHATTNKYIDACGGRKSDDVSQSFPSRSRRNVLIQLLSLTTPAVVFTRSTTNQANAVVMAQPKDKIFEAGVAMGSDVALQRFYDGKQTLQYLLDHYDEISAGGGDNVRRYLGTVGLTSPLYGIQKELRELQDVADDVVEFTETMNDFEYSFRAADTAVYSANFVEYSAASTKPEQFFKDAKVQIKLMKQYMDEMEKQLPTKK